MSQKEYTQNNIKREKKKAAGSRGEGAQARAALARGKMAAAGECQNGTPLGWGSHGWRWRGRRRSEVAAAVEVHGCSGAAVVFRREEGEHNVECGVVNPAVGSKAAECR